MAINSLKRANEIDKSGNLMTRNSSAKRDTRRRWKLPERGRLSQCLNIFFLPRVNTIVLPFHPVLFVIPSRIRGLTVPETLASDANASSAVDTDSTPLLEKDSLTIVTFELGLTRWQLGCLILAARFRSGRLLCAFADLETVSLRALLSRAHAV